MKFVALAAILVAVFAIPAAGAATGTLAGTVGPGFNISLKQAGKTVSKLRAGTYFEPSRFEAGYRVHATLGTDVRLFSWDLFGLLDEFTFSAGAAADVAERYLNAGVGIGLWH